MTVSYTSKVASSKSIGCFLKLLLRWRGSIYKLVWPDLFFFLSIFFSLSIVYRFFLDDEQQRMFEKIALYCEKYGTLIPVSFVLGFYVSIIIGRWWQQYRAIPWIDTLAIWVNSNIHGEEEKDRVLRRTLMRYTCLSITQCFTLISPRVKKRFPTLDHLVEGGLLLDNEKEIIEELRASVAQGAQYPTYFIPLVWTAGIMTRARSEGKVKSDAVLKTMIDEVNRIKDNCQLLISYDWISVPLVYTQVVTLAVYVYFFSCIMGRQWVKNYGGSGSEGPSAEGTSSGSAYGKQGVEGLDLVFPVFTVLQFFFYMGWLKVAESLLNPFGDDDDDFELNWIVDRNLQVSYLIVDEMHKKHPELLRDQYWDEVVPTELPHTIASSEYKEEPPISSTANVVVSDGEGEILSPSLRSNLHLYGSRAVFQDIPETPGSKRRTSILRERFQSQRSNSNHSQVTLSTIGSVSGKLNRIGGAFKRMISRERRPSAGQDVEVFGSLINIQGQQQDAIPELDENMVTIVSMKKPGQVKPPTVQEIFGSRDTAADAGGVLHPETNSSPLPRPPTSLDSMTTTVVTVETPDPKSDTDPQVEDKGRGSPYEDIDKIKSSNV